MADRITYLPKTTNVPSKADRAVMESLFGGGQQQQEGSFFKQVSLLRLIVPVAAFILLSTMWFDDWISRIGLTTTGIKLGFKIIILIAVLLIAQLFGFA